jgi:pilus assembly protein CpaB
MLSLASNETHLQLVLRNPMDTEIAKPPGTVMSNLFGGAYAAEPEPSSPPRNEPLVRQPAMPAIADPAAPSLYVIEVSNGAVHTQAKFSQPRGKQ